MVTGTSVTLSKQDSSGDTNDYETVFDLGLKAVNQTDQELNWYLVRTDSSVASFNDFACTLQSEKDDTNNTKYYYSGCTAKDALTKLGDGVLIGYGKINGSANNALSSDTKENMTNDDNLKELFQSETNVAIGLTNQTLYTKTDNAQKHFTTYHYYLVVEFPDTKSDQNAEGANFGKTISVTFDEINNIQSNVVAAAE